MLKTFCAAGDFLSPGLDRASHHSNYCHQVMTDLPLYDFDTVLNTHVQHVTWWQVQLTRMLRY